MRVRLRRWISSFLFQRIEMVDHRFQMCGFIKSYLHNPKLHNLFLFKQTYESYHHVGSQNNQALRYDHVKFIDSLDLKSSLIRIS